MNILIALAAAFQISNPQIDVAHQHNDITKRCMTYDQYKSMAKDAGVRMAVRALQPNGTIVQFWVKHDKSWGVVLIKKVNGQSVACFYRGGVGWEETDEN